MLTRARSLFLASGTLYCLAIGSVRLAMDRPAFFMLDIFPPLFALVGGSMLGVRWLLDAAPPRPTPPWRPYVVAMLTLAVMAMVQVTFVTSRDLIPVVNGYQWDAVLWTWDRVMHGGRPPRDWLTPLLAAHPRATYALGWFYFPGYMLLTIIVPAVVAVLRETELTNRYLLGWVLNSVLLANVTATAMSSVGPVYFDPATGALGPYEPLLASIDALNIGDLAARQRDYWDMPESFGVTAFPSLHLAEATHWGLLLATARPRLRVPAALLLLTVLVGSVAFGFHYAADGYAGILGALGTWWLAGRLCTHHSSKP